MAIKLQDKPNTLTPDAEYPYGDIKDNPGDNTGTPVNKLVYADFHQFFARLLDLSGIAANGVPDNAYDGFQYYEALVQIINDNVAGLLELKGDIDASSNPNYPSALKGDSYVITVAGKVGGASGKVVAAGDYLIAKADNAGGTEASVGTSWFVLERNIDLATETNAGIAEIATQAETNTGTDNERFVTPAKLHGRVATETLAGIAEIATQAEADGNTDDSRIITSLKLKNYLLNSPDWISVNAGNQYYRKDFFGFVHLAGSLGSVSGQGNFTLPVGYRPAAGQSFPQMWQDAPGNNGSISSIDISTGGVVSSPIITGAGTDRNIPLNGISFKAL